jgi:hypothetical protein
MSPRVLGRVADDSTVELIVASLPLESCPLWNQRHLQFPDAVLSVGRVSF